MWLGDSYAVGSNSSAGTLIAPEAARLLGWNDCYVSGRVGYTPAAVGTETTALYAELATQLLGCLCSWSGSST